jgi:hypothetical protein
VRRRRLSESTSKRQFTHQSYSKTIRRQETHQLSTVSTGVVENLGRVGERVDQVRDLLNEKRSRLGESHSAHGLEAQKKRSGGEQQ